MRGKHAKPAKPRAEPRKSALGPTPLVSAFPNFILFFWKGHKPSSAVQPKKKRLHVHLDLPETCDPPSASLIHSTNLTRRQLVGHSSFESRTECGAV